MKGERGNRKGGRLVAIGRVMGLVGFAAAVVGCRPSQPEGGAVPMASAPAGANALTPDEQRAGWRLLFDGRTSTGWRSYSRDSLPAGWQAVDGGLTRVGPGGDIITREPFRDFELSLEWMVKPGGNSGIFYRVALGSEFMYYSGPEMQVLDDAAHRDGVSPLTSAGAVYGLYPAPRGLVRPAGQWNTARIVVRGSQVEHWLNGQHIASYELGSADWTRRVRESKFAQWPEYGKAAEGHIGLQDHGDWVAYRNIKIRELK
ncbi:MAG: 3-keto-disaccharide hydrolase [Gemmatimonadales bacterium]